MPMVYAVVGGAVLATNATPLTTNDSWYVHPGTTRNVGLQALYVQGRGAGLTAISGITFRIEKWTVSGSTAGTGTAITPGPRDPGMQAAKASAAQASTQAGIFANGSGGPTLLLAIGCGAAGPGGWVAPNPDSVHILEAAATMSLDIFSASGTASLLYEASAEIVE
jgi:hypothetical protein